MRGHDRTALVTPERKTSTRLNRWARRRRQLHRLHAEAAALGEQVLDTSDFETPFKPTSGRALGMASSIRSGLRHRVNISVSSFSGQRELTVVLTQRIQRLRTHNLD
jgi:hypothetical protein